MIDFKDSGLSFSGSTLVSKISTVLAKGPSKNYVRYLLDWYKSYSGSFLLVSCT